MQIKQLRTSSVILLVIGSLLIWMGYHIMKLERLADKYLFFIGLLSALLGTDVFCYLLIWPTE